MNILDLKSSLKVAFIKKIVQIRRDFSSEDIVQFDIAVFPWHGNIELSVRLANDNFDDMDFAAWPHYNVSGFTEGQWPEIAEACEQIQIMYEQDFSILNTENLFKLVAEVINSPQVALEIDRLSSNKEFQVTLYHPDDSRSNPVNYCF